MSRRAGGAGTPQLVGASLAELAAAWRAEADALTDERARRALRRAADAVDAGTRGGAALTLPADRYWTQKEAAAFLGVSARYLRESSCPKLLLPGNGVKGVPLVRYDPAQVRRWAEQWRTGAMSRSFAEAG